MNRIVLECRKAKETKGTWPFEEIEAGGGDVVVGSFYVKKAALGERPPKRLRVTIEALAPTSG